MLNGGGVHVMQVFNFGDRGCFQSFKHNQIKAIFL